MKVKATDMSSKLGLKIKELHRVASPGEEFEVSPMRYEVLSGKNRFKAVFVVLAEKEKKIETNVPKKKGRKSKEPKIVEEVLLEENA